MIDRRKLRLYVALYRKKARRVHLRVKLRKLRLKEQYHAVTLRLLERLVPETEPTDVDGGDESDGG